MTEARGAVYEPSVDSDMPLLAVILDGEGQLAQVVIVPSVAEGEVLIDQMLAQRKARAAGQLP